MYDYCDKMMKDLSQFDKAMENRQSAKKLEQQMRYSNQNKQNADQILNGYLNDADGIMGQQDESGLNKSGSQSKNKMMAQKEFH